MFAGNAASALRKRVLRETARYASARPTPHQRARGGRSAWIAIELYSKQVGPTVRSISSAASVSWHFAAAYISRVCRVSGYSHAARGGSDWKERLAHPHRSAMWF